MKITCNEDTRSKLIRDNAFPASDICECRNMLGVKEKDCLIQSCPDCKANNIKWEIEDSEEEQKPEPAKLTIRDIAEAFVHCNDYKMCVGCPLEQCDGCRFEGGKMILALLDQEAVTSADEPKAITWDEIQNMLGVKIYLRARDGQIKEVVPVQICEENGEKYVKLYSLKEDYVFRFFFESPSELNPIMKLYLRDPDKS